MRNRRHLFLVLLPTLALGAFAGLAEWLRPSTAYELRFHLDSWEMPSATSWKRVNAALAGALREDRTATLFATAFAEELTARGAAREALDWIADRSRSFGSSTPLEGQPALVGAIREYLGRVMVPHLDRRLQGSLPANRPDWLFYATPDEQLHLFVRSPNRAVLEQIARPTATAWNALAEELDGSRLSHFSEHLDLHQERIQQRIDLILGRTRLLEEENAQIRARLTGEEPRCGTLEAENRAEIRTFLAEQRQALSVSDLVSWQAGLESAAEAEPNCTLLREGLHRLWGNQTMQRTLLGADWLDGSAFAVRPASWSRVSESLAFLPRISSDELDFSTTRLSGPEDGVPGGAPPLLAGAAAGGALGLSLLAFQLALQLFREVAG